MEMDEMSPAICETTARPELSVGGALIRAEREVGRRSARGTFMEEDEAREMSPWATTYMGNHLGAHMGAQTGAHMCNYVGNNTGDLTSLAMTWAKGRAKLTDMATTWATYIRKLHTRLPS